VLVQCRYFLEIVLSLLLSGKASFFPQLPSSSPFSSPPPAASFFFFRISPSYLFSDFPAQPPSVPAVDPASDYRHFLLRTFYNLPFSPPLLQSHYPASFFGAGKCSSFPINAAPNYPLSLSIFFTHPVVFVFFSFEMDLAALFVLLVFMFFPDFQKA